MKDLLLFIGAAGAMVAFAVIFFLALTEQRAADPIRQAYGDVVSRPDDVKLFHARDTSREGQHDNAR